MEKQANTVGAVAEPSANLESRHFDVIVIGASLAGCSAATFYGRAGLKVALVERQRDPLAYKRLCTHFIQASAVPVLRRLGIESAIVEADAQPNPIDLRTRHGWTLPTTLQAADGSELHGYNLRRQKLDPIIRALAAGTPGVELMAGCSLRSLRFDGNRVVGATIDGDRSLSLNASLVVAADGRQSSAAQLAGARLHSSANKRFGLLVYLRNVPLASRKVSKMWFEGSRAGYLFPNDDGLTVCALMASKREIEPFRADPLGALRQAFREFPDAPDLAAVELVGDPMLVKDFANQWRDPVVKGMALIGDAGMSLDYLWGVGCGWAMQSAEWLVDATAAPIRQGQGLDHALSGYAGEVRRNLAGHRFLINDFARRESLNPIEHLLFSAATRDPALSRHVHEYGARMIGPARFLAPGKLLRALWVNWRARGQRNLATASGAG